MGVSLGYSIVEKTQPIKAHYSSDMIRRLERQWPRLRFEPSDVPTLFALANCTDDEIFKEIAELVQKFGPIQLHQEY